MELENLKKELDLMSFNNVITDYYLKRVSVDRYELQVNHTINNKLFCVLIDFDYSYFNTDNELKRLKELMVKNYIKYLS